MKSRGYIFLASLLIIAAGLVVHLHETEAVELITPLAELPEVKGDWRMTRDHEFSAEILNKLRPTDYLSRSYVGEQGRRIALYIGYHNGGPQSGEIHSPKHCLPGGGWHELSSNVTRLETPNGEKLKMVKAVYAKNRRQVTFFYWFQVMDSPVTSEYNLKLRQIVNQLIHGRKDAAFIRISTLGADEADEEETVRSFLNAYYQPIIDILPR